MLRHLAFCLALGLVAGPFASGQQLPSFETAAVKPGSHPHTKEGYSWSDVKMTDATRFRAINANLAELIEWAYDVRTDLVSGPEWIHSKETTFDIDATVPAGAEKAQARLMLRRLLAERFGFESHMERKIESGYRLVVDKGGPKLLKSAENSPRQIASAGGRTVSKAIGMERLASYISSEIGRPVEDGTGLAGYWQIDVQYSTRPDDSSHESLSSAMQGLGLRLERADLPVEYLKVDRASQTPATN